MFLAGVVEPLVAERKGAHHAAPCGCGMMASSMKPRSAVKGMASRRRHDAFDRRADHRGAWGGYAKEQGRVAGSRPGALHTPRHERRPGQFHGVPAEMALECYGLKVRGAEGAGTALVTDIERGEPGGGDDPGRACVEVTAVTGRQEPAERLRGFGAANILPVEDVADASTKPLESEVCARCVGAVGGAMLARAGADEIWPDRAGPLGRRYGSAGQDHPIPASGVTCLVRLDPARERRIIVGEGSARDFDMEKLDTMTKPARPADLRRHGVGILKRRTADRVMNLNI